MTPCRLLFCYGRFEGVWRLRFHGSQRRRVSRWEKWLIRADLEHKSCAVYRHNQLFFKGVWFWKLYRSACRMFCSVAHKNSKVVIWRVDNSQFILSNTHDCTMSSSWWSWQSTWYESWPKLKEALMIVQRTVASCVGHGLNNLHGRSRWRWRSNIRC